MQRRHFQQKDLNIDEVQVREGVLKLLLEKKLMPTKEARAQNLSASK